MNVGSSSSQNVLESETGELIHPRLTIRSLNDCLGGLAWDALRSGFEKGTFKTEDQLTRRLQALGSRFIVVGLDLHAVTHLDVIDLSHEGLVPGGWTSLPAVSAVRDRFEEIRDRKRKVRAEEGGGGGGGGGGVDLGGSGKKVRREQGELRRVLLRVGPMAKPALTVSLGFISRRLDSSSIRSRPSFIVTVPVPVHVHVRPHLQPQQPSSSDV